MVVVQRSMLDTELAQDLHLVGAAPWLEQRGQNTVRALRPPWESTAGAHRRRCSRTAVPWWRVLPEAGPLWAVDGVAPCNAFGPGMRWTRCALPSNRTGRRKSGLALALRLEGSTAVEVAVTCTAANRIPMIAIARSWCWLFWSQEPSSAKPLWGAMLSLAAMRSLSVQASTWALQHSPGAV